MAVRRYRNSSIMIEHPADDEVVTAILKKYRFHSKRSVLHMHREI
jgi:hypothetical protein